MKPRVSILSPDFKYVPAVSTDVARTFARIRREQRGQAEHARRQQLASATRASIRTGCGERRVVKLDAVRAPNQASRAGITSDRGSDATEDVSAIVREPSYA
jgi:hypothetical protein